MPEQPSLPGLTNGGTTLSKTELRAMATSILIERMQFMRQHGLTFDGARDEYEIFGYDRVITNRQYRAEYQRGGVAGRAVDAFPNATWRGGFELIEDEDAYDPKNYTPLEQAWNDLAARLQINAKFLRVDKLAGLSTFAVLLIGAPGELETELPKGKPEDLKYLQPFSGGGVPGMSNQYRAHANVDADCSVFEFETDPASERFGSPRTYTLKRTDFTSPVFARPVHWSRIHHIAENLLDDDISGLPRLERVWNLFADLRKVTGGGAEAFWLRANQGLHIDVDKDMATPDAAFAIEVLKQQAEAYKHQMDRWLRTKGTDVNVLGSDVANFEGPADAILTQIAGALAIPKRILTGSEMGELASSQDRDNWRDQVQGRQDGYAGPNIVRPFVNRLIDYGYLPKPKKGDDQYIIRWSKIDTRTDQEKTAGASGWASVNASYGDTVFTDEEIRDYWHGMPPLTDEQKKEIEDKKAKALKDQQELMKAKHPPQAEEDEEEDEEFPRAAEDAELIRVLEAAILAGNEEVVHEIIGLGGPGSGNFGHSGRPGQVGGSGGRSISAKSLETRNTPIPLHHSSNVEFEGGKPAFDAFFGSEEFVEAFGPNEFGEHRYTLTLPPETRILDLNKDTKDTREFKARMAEIQWPDDREFHAKIRAGDPEVIADADYDIYELWTDKRLAMQVLRTMKGADGVKYQHEYALPKETIAKLPGEKFRAGGGPGSGNFGHAGRPGEIGGSAPAGGGGVTPATDNSLQLQRENAKREFQKLSADYARINNELQMTTSFPQSEEAKAKNAELRAITKRMLTLEADPGGIDDIMLPGEPRDVVIIGAGPAGLAASAMAGYEGLDTLLIDSEVEPGGQAKYSSRVENLPGYEVGVKGPDMYGEMNAQVIRLGSEERLGVEAVGLEYDESTGFKTVVLSNGERIRTRAVVLAGGVSITRANEPGSTLQIPGSTPNNTYYSDNSRSLDAIARTNPVVIAGGGNGAAQAALGMARHGNAVTIVARNFNKMSKNPRAAIENHPNITIELGEEVESMGAGQVRLKSGKSVPGQAMGVYFGGPARTNWLPDSIKRNKHGQIEANQGTMETSIPGVFAAGDIRDKTRGSIGGAIGDGQMSIFSAFQYFAKVAAKKAS